MRALGGSVGCEFALVPTQGWLEGISQFPAHPLPDFAAKGHGIRAAPGQVAQISVGCAPAMGLYMGAGFLQGLEQGLTLSPAAAYIGLQHPRLRTAYLGCPGCHARDDAASFGLGGNVKDPLVRTDKDQGAIIEVGIVPPGQSGGEMWDTAVKH
jgi:hypothetical protein